MTSVMAPPLVNRVKTPADATSLQKTADGQDKEQGMPRGHLRKNGSLRRKNEQGPQNGKYWNANGSFRSVLGGGGAYMQRPISIHQIPPSNNYPFAPPIPNFNLNGSTRPILDMRLKSSTSYLANNYLASQQQGRNFMHEIYNGNYNSVDKQYYNSSYLGHGKSSLPYGLPTNSWQPAGIKPPSGILCFNNMAVGPGRTTSIEPRYQPYIMPSHHHSPFSFNYSNNNYNYHYNKHYNGQNGMGWQENLKLNAGSGSANGIYYIKNNYGDINNHVNNGAGEVNRGNGTEPAKNKGPLAKRTSGDTVYFNTPPIQMGKPVGAAVPSEPSIFVSPKGETYKLVSVNGTSYVVPCSPTDIISNGNTSNVMYNAGSSGFYGGIPSAYDPYKAPSKVPTFHNTIHKVSTSQIKLSSNATSVNAFPQVHKKAGNSMETTSKLEKAVSATTNVAMIHSSEPNSKDEDSTISSTTNNSINPNDKSSEKLLSPEAANDKKGQITKFSDIALNEDGEITTEYYSDRSLLNSHSSLLEELKMAMDSENRVTNCGLDESFIKCKLYPEWTTSQLDSQKGLQENLIQTQPILPDDVILSEDLKHKSVEDLNMSVLNMPLKPPTRTNTVCCAIM